MSGLFKSTQDNNQAQNTSNAFNQTGSTNFNTNTTGATTGTTNNTFGTTANSTSTSAGTAPDWVTAAIRGATGATTALAGQNPRDFVAGADPSLVQAATTANGLTGSPWDYNAAEDETGYVMNANAPRINAAQAAPYISTYLSPYENDVINSTMADFDRSAGQTKAQDDLNLAGSGAFGGSGAAITKSLTAGELARARASTLSGLENQNYSQALGAAENDAGRKQEAATTNAQLAAGQMDRALQAANQKASLASDYDANQRANVAAQTGVGSILQGILQQQAAAPLTLAQFGTQNLSDLLRGFFGGTTTNSGTTGGTSAGTTAGTTTGTSTGTSNTAASGTSSGTSSGSGTTTNNPSAMSDIGDLLAIASMFTPSDERLKRDVRRIGTRADGIGVYLYRYLWSPARHIGVMAQEVLKVKPQAVFQHPDGFLMVDYARL